MLKKVNPNRYLPNFMCFFICGVIYANKLIREFLTLAFFRIILYLLNGLSFIIYGNLNILNASRLLSI